jgi:hypothetical protein
MHAKSLTHIITALVLTTTLTAACGGGATPAAGDGSSAPAAGAYAPLRSQVLDRSAEMGRAANALRTSATAYLELARAANFDYDALLGANKAAVLEHVLEARAAWRNAAVSYSYMEGIVAGAPALADYDVILDTGSSAGEGDESVAPYDLTLADGRVLKQPGNLFSVLEALLWGTRPEFRAPGDVAADFDGDGAVGFGDHLPDAAVLSAAADALVEQSAALEKAASAWQPSENDAFLSLLIMTPSLGDYIDAWKESRFVMGDASLHAENVGLSRIADLDGVMKGLRIVFDAAEPRIRAVDPATADMFDAELSTLARKVADTAKAEAGGRRFSTLEAAALADDAAQVGQKLADALFAAAEKAGIRIDE